MQPNLTHSLISSVMYMEVMISKFLIFLEQQLNLTEMVSDTESLCKLLEEHDSSTVVGSTTSSHTELDDLHNK